MTATAMSDSMRIAAIPKPTAKCAGLREPRVMLMIPFRAATADSDKIWLVSFMSYDLGFFDHETCRIESAEKSLRR